MKLMVALIAAFAACFAMAYDSGAADVPAPAADAPAVSLTPLDSIDQRVLACTPCHGKEGRATSDGYYPRIAGKPAGYLFNQLQNFREGRRNYPMMTYLVQFQREDYLREIAEYFASQRLPYPAPQLPQVDNSVLARGHVLVTQGDPAQNLPACSACHGERLAGVTPAVPGLLGLSRDYLAAQLGAWRSGTREAHAPDCMAEIVRRMRPDDLSAVTAWLAAQPVEATQGPETSFQYKPPLTCGSIRDADHTP